MLVSPAAVLIALSVIFAFGLIKFLIPLFQERRRGKKILHGIGGLPPHWLTGHIEDVSNVVQNSHCLCFDL